ncbi:amidophosphoribosyltransferase [Candidatus Contubernalis alkalaceticus]|nr:amidophosphoribosyltransferase [Candidatus Contubernalis alkalaceticus]
MQDGTLEVGCDKFKEECGVFGIYAPGHNVAQITHYALYALQHRGQESAGIAVSNGGKMDIEKGMGLVSEVLNGQKTRRLTGHMAVGHVRYSTMGSSSLVNAQPLMIRYSKGCLAISHNGNLVNGREIRDNLGEGGAIFQTTTDSEIVAHLIARLGGDIVEDTISQALAHLEGAFTFVIMTEDKLIGARDPHGIRPLSLGLLDGCYVLASETCAFDTIGAEFIRDIDPGEMVVIDNQGLHTRRFAPEKPLALCIFEFIYFARPDSNIHGQNVHLVRRELGKQLAREYPVEADIVTGVPDSSISAASGVAEEMGLPYEMGLIKNRYIGRTFIQPSQEIRDLGVKLKLNAVKKVVKGKRIVLVDDSIVRGTTSKQIVQMLRKAGATEVHVRISSPPVISPCFYGIDTSSTKELLGAFKTVEEIKNIIKADSLGYLSIEGLVSSVGLSRDSFCKACFDKEYIVQPTSGLKKKLFETTKR